jgi:hypothetical protein
MNYFDKQRARRAAGRHFDRHERERRRLTETPPAMPSPEILSMTTEEIAEAEAAEARYIAEYLRTHYAPGELGAFRRRQRQD